MGKIDDLLDCAEEFTRSQTERLNSEITFVRAFQDVSDTLKSGIVTQIMTGGFLSAPLPSTGLEDILAINDLISSPAAATDFINQQQNFVTSAVDKLIDPSLPTGFSDVFSDALQGFVSSAVSDATTAAFEAIQNRVIGTGQQLSNTTARAQGVLFGSPGEVQETGRSVYDGTKRAFNKAFSLAGLAITADPAAIFGLAGVSITGLNGSLTIENQKLAEAQSLVNDIVVLCAEFTSSFYGVADVANIETSRGLLQEADSQLVTVRSRMLTLGAFNSEQFTLAKDKVEDASDALDQGLTTNPKIAEINSKLNRLEILVDEIDSDHGKAISVKNNVEGSITFWLQDRIFGSLFAGQIHNVQTEIRSIIESMDSALVSSRRGLIIPLLAVWRAQLLLTLQTMCALPAEINKYLDDDPDTFRSDLQVTIDALNAIPDFVIDLFVSTTTSFIKSVRQKLAVPVALSSITSFAVAVGTEIAGATSFISSVTTALNSHVFPNTATETLAANLVSLFDSAGMDRAVQLLQNSDLTAFFALTSKTASFTGALLAEIDDAIQCLRDQPGTLQQGITALQEVQDFVFNTKRSEELLTVTFGQFRDGAIDDVTGIGIPQIQSVDATIQRVAADLVGGPCDT